MIKIDSRRKVRTKAIAIPRDWRRVAKATLKAAEEARRHGDYETAMRLRELSRALDPADES